MVSLKNDEQGYGSVTRLFHWVMVALVAFQFGSIVVFRYLEEGATDATWRVLNAHKTSGLLVLLVGALRLAWRRLSPLPAWPKGFDAWDKRVSHVAEYGLYASMFAIALSGIGIELAGGHYVPFFDLVHLDARAPLLHAGAVSHAAEVEAARTALTTPLVRDLLVALHVVCAFTTVALFATHLTHVLRHHVGLRDGLLGRMVSGKGGDG